MNKTARITWIDTAKFIGIFCIYLGHFGNSAGRSYPFVFIFHVPLFFFLSGYLEYIFCTKKNSTKPFITYTVKCIKKILLPMYLFSIASLALRCLADRSLSAIYLNWKFILMGNVRNTFFASGLWFLSCLFVIKLLFTFIKKLFYKPWQLLLISTVFSICIHITITALAQPQWFFNIDSALFYMFYFALGYCLPVVEQKWKTITFTYKTAVKYVVAILLLIYSIGLYFNIDPFNFLYTNTITSICYTLIKPVFLIILVIYISKRIPQIGVLENIGQNTLYLCGTEYIIKFIVPLILGYCGISVVISSPLVAYLYTFFLLLLCNYIAVPIEKMIFHFLKL